MARPAFVICDADALIQFFLLQELRPLQLLRAKYLVKPLVVAEVEIELLSHRRHGPSIALETKKALANGLISLLDQALLEAHYGGGTAGRLAATQALSNIGRIGAQNFRHADSGEAYTHAAALELGVPSLSNDITALNALVQAGSPVPATVLRPFDLVALAFQVGQLSGNECDAIHSGLISNGEHVPGCFQRSSFTNGLSDFTPRICDTRNAGVGRSRPPAYPFANVIDL